MKKIGITGNLGCGKSTVGKMFKKLGAIVVDADEIIREFYEKNSPIYDKLVSLLGDKVVNERGDIDRKRVADIVFENPELLKKLEKITHTALYERLGEIEKNLGKDDIFMIEASLIFEKNTRHMYDKVIVVYAPYDECKKRAVEKGMPPEDFERRMRYQMDIDKKRELADIVIDNSGDISSTWEQVKKVYKILKSDP